MNLRRHVLPLSTAVRLSALPPFSIPIPIPPLLPKQNPPPKPTQNPNSDFSRISSLLSNPPGPGLEEALTAAEINPNPNLFLQVFNHFDSTPKRLFTLFNWARKRPDYEFSVAAFNAVVNSLGKAREFDSAWCLILEQIKGDSSERPDFDTFIIMIRRSSVGCHTNVRVRVV